jgi:hypothetical protein
MRRHVRPWPDYAAVLVLFIHARIIHKTTFFTLVDVIRVQTFQLGRNSVRVRKRLSAKSQPDP